MKKSVLKPVMLTIAVVSMTMLISGSLFAQDTVIKKPHKVMKIKVELDEDGNSFTVDTSFVIDENFSMDHFNEAMKEYEVQMKDVKKYLKEMDIELDGEEMERAMQEIETSLYEVHRKMPGKRNFHRGIKRGPRHLEYLYEPGNVHFFGMPGNCYETVHINSRKKGESLSDVLGDIPMSAVKSYKIKETKNGKRITIEISDDAFFGNDDEEILIWHSDVPSPPPPPRKPQLRKQIFIEKEVEKEEDDK